MTTSPKKCRAGERCEPVTLREAWHCQVHHAEARVDELARQVGMQPSTLSEFVNPYSEGSPLPSRHHERLLELTKDNPAVLTYMAQIVGGVFLRVDTSTMLAQTAETVREFGELLTAHAIAHSDGVIDERELAQIRHRGQIAMAAIAALVEQSDRSRGLRAVAGERR